MNKDLLCIILNYNSWEDTLKEVDILIDILKINKKNILVVDNCSTDDSFVQLQKFSNTKYLLLNTKQNNGYASGNNFGLKYAYENGYRYAWILNNDILINDRDIIRKLMAVFKEDEKIAVVNPDIYSPEGKVYNRDSVKPSFMDYTFCALSYRKKGRVLRLNGDYGLVYRPQGCCMMVDVVKLNEINYMDENTFLYCEEIILAERLLKRGYYCACCVNTSVVHNHSQTIKRLIDRTKIIKIKEKSFKYYLKNYRNFNSIQRHIILLFDKLKWYLID